MIVSWVNCHCGPALAAAAGRGARQVTKWCPVGRGLPVEVVPVVARAGIMTAPPSVHRLLPSADPQLQPAYAQDDHASVPQMTNRHPPDKHRDAYQSVRVCMVRHLFASRSAGRGLLETSATISRRGEHVKLANCLVTCWGAVPTLRRAARPYIRTTRRSPYLFPGKPNASRSDL